MGDACGPRCLLDMTNDDPTTKEIKVYVTGKCAHGLSIKQVHLDFAVTLVELFQYSIRHIALPTTLQLYLRQVGLGLVKLDSSERSAARGCHISTMRPWACKSLAHGESL